MTDMSSIISSHNKRLLRPRTTEYGSNCRTRENRQLQNQWLAPNIIWRADVENNRNKFTTIYFDLVATSFKARFRNHNKDFNHGQYREITELSKYMWWLKEEQIISRIRWSVVEKVYGKTKICPPWLAEKVHLIEHFNDNRLLNKRN